jgi:hypothetical protein
MTIFVIEVKFIFNGRPNKVSSSLQSPNVQAPSPNISRPEPHPNGILSGHFAFGAPTLTNTKLSSASHASRTNSKETELFGTLENAEPSQILRSHGFRTLQSFEVFETTAHTSSNCSDFRCAFKRVLNRKHFFNHPINAFCQVHRRDRPYGAVLHLFLYFQDLFLKKREPAAAV